MHVHVATDHLKQNMPNDTSRYHSEIERRKKNNAMVPHILSHVKDRKLCKPNDNSVCFFICVMLFFLCAFVFMASALMHCERRMIMISKNSSVA